MNSQLLAGWLNARAELKHDRHKASLTAIVDDLQAAYDLGSASSKLDPPWADWIRWVPKEENQEADEAVHIT